MAILKKCAQCKRTGGYAESPKDKVCARCKKQKLRNLKKHG